MSTPVGLQCSWVSPGKIKIEGNISPTCKPLGSTESFISSLTISLSPLGVDIGQGQNIGGYRSRIKWTPRMNLSHCTREQSSSGRRKGIMNKIEVRQTHSWTSLGVFYLRTHKDTWVLKLLFMLEKMCPTFETGSAFAPTWLPFSSAFCLGFVLFCLSYSLFLLFGLAHLPWFPWHSSTFLTT